MAALWDAQIIQIVDLKQVQAEVFEPILEAETGVWREQLHWDFHSSAELVRRFISMHALSGVSLTLNGRPVGYSYYVCEDRKGLIGDLFVLEEYRSAENEGRLLGAILQALVQSPYVKRIESQLMMMRSAVPTQLPHTRFLRTYERDFMLADLSGAAGLPAGSSGGRLLFENWSEERQDEAAYLIASAYDGHVDSEINDQYRSISGARRFLTNIVQYPGCGSFWQPASWIALHEGRVCGISLASLVASDVGHITQICVAPEVQGTGAGYELLRHSLRSLAAKGCQEVTLTVTSSNHRAIRLYEHVGFRTLRRFSACVWEGF
ncbi:MAG: GNAT family N-acetyltransferase [Bryobacteraceae bacterium]